MSSIYERLVSLSDKGTPNYSLYAIPAMWGLNMVPHFAAALLYSGGKFTNRSPREFHASVERKAQKSETDRKFLRAEACQLNGFENIGWFAAAVVAANAAKVPSNELNALTGSYLASRILYTLLYVGVSSEQVSYLRSGSYLAGVSIVFTLFIRAARAFQ